MKMTNKIFLLASIFLASACTSSGGTSDSGSDLEATLRGNSFTVEGLDDVIDDCSGGSSTDSDGSTGTETANPTANLSLGTSRTDEEQIVSFSTTTFNYLVDGETEVSGTWEADDDDTIIITVDGEEISIDIEVDGDTITVTADDCSDSDSGSDGDSIGVVTVCEADCLGQGGTDTVCSDGCDGDDTNDCTDEIDDDCFELCIASDNDAFDCAENECDISCASQAALEI